MIAQPPLYVQSPQQQALSRAASQVHHSNLAGSRSTQADRRRPLELAAAPLFSSLLSTQRGSDCCNSVDDRDRARICPRPARARMLALFDSVRIRMHAQEQLEVCLKGRKCVCVCGELLSRREEGNNTAAITTQERTHSQRISSRGRRGSRRGCERDVNPAATLLLLLLWARLCWVRVWPGATRDLLRRGEKNSSRQKGRGEGKTREKVKHRGPDAPVWRRRVVVGAADQQSESRVGKRGEEHCSLSAGATTTHPGAHRGGANRRREGRGGWYIGEQGRESFLESLEGVDVCLLVQFSGGLKETER